MWAYLARGQQLAQLSQRRQKNLPLQQKFQMGMSNKYARPKWTICTGLSLLIPLLFIQVKSTALNSRSGAVVVKFDEYNRSAEQTSVWAVAVCEEAPPFRPASSKRSRRVCGRMLKARSSRNLSVTAHTKTVNAHLSVSFRWCLREACSIYPITLSTLPMAIVRPARKRHIIKLMFISQCMSNLYNGILWSCKKDKHVMQITKVTMTSENATGYWIWHVDSCE